MLIAQELHKRLNGYAVLRGVSLSCPAGTSMIIRGANGAGKSTLLRVLVGVLRPEHGEVEINGFSLRTRPDQAKSQLGFAPDATEALPELTVGEFLQLVRALKRVASPPNPLHADRAERLGLTALAGTRLSALSFGQRKKTLLLAALIGEPAWLLIDEPNAGLDPESELAVLELLRERTAQGSSNVLTSNDDNFAARIGGTQLELRDGRLDPIARGA